MKAKLAVFLSVCFIALMMTTGMGHAASMYVTNQTGNDDIVEFDTSGNFIRSFNTTLQGQYTGSSMQVATQLRWGSDGLLYHYGRFNDGQGNDNFGVLAWNKNGSLANFYPRYSAATPPPLDVWGFEVAKVANGNFYTVDVDSMQRVKEWDRTFTTPIVYGTSAMPSYPDGWDEGDQNAVLFGNGLYVVGASILTKYDTTTKEWVAGWGTGMDNQTIAASSTGLIAVNDQWADFSQQASLEIYKADGTFEKRFDMPDIGWTTRGLVFDKDGKLYVASQYQDSTTGQEKSAIVIFDEDFDQTSKILLDSNYIQNIGDITLGPSSVPEPSTLLSLLTGLAMLGGSVRLWGKK